MSLTKDQSRFNRDQVKYVAKKDFHLNLKGKTAVFIDAANIELSAKELVESANFYLDLRKVKSKIQRDENKA